MSLPAVIRQHVNGQFEGRELLREATWIRFKCKDLGIYSEIWDFETDEECTFRIDNRFRVQLYSIQLFVCSSILSSFLSSSHSFFHPPFLLFFLPSFLPSFLPFFCFFLLFFRFFFHSFFCPSQSFVLKCYILTSVIESYRFVGAYQTFKKNFLVFFKSI